MKLSPLLAQYLYQNKELNLTGIGRFTFNPLSGLDPRTGKEIAVEGIIEFEHNKSVKEDPKLIEFISEQTGKMKSLAGADLDTHLELARQFLNIGNPFHFEGIGTLTKTKSRQIKFSQGPSLHERVNQPDGSQGDMNKSSEESFTDYEEMLSPKKPVKTIGQKMIMVLFILIGLGLAIWGGYYVYTNYSAGPENPAQADTTVPAEQSFNPEPKDTAIQIQTPSDTYRFVIEESGRERALSRFDKLRSWGIDVFIDTSNELQYKLYFNLKVLPADTARIRDSLALMYSNTGKAKIE